MPLQLPGPRTNLRPACQSCLEQSPHIRKRLEKLYKEIFYFNFKNLFYATGRHNTFLCYQVKRTQHGLTNPLDRGVFTKQDDPLSPPVLLQDMSPRRAVLPLLVPRAHAGPRGGLPGHLVYILEPLLYVCRRDGQLPGHSPQREPHHLLRPPLLLLELRVPEWASQAVSGRGPGEGHDLPRSPMSLLKEDIFLYQFNNQQQVQKPYFRRRTYLCYQLEQPNGSRPQWPAKGCLQNKKGHHAEIRFIKRIHSMGLEQDQDYQITCYITWSPCLACACALAELKNHFPRLTLRIFASRLYFHWIRKFQMGLQHLYKSGVLVAVMSLPEFTDCWEKFVNHRQVFFTPWDKLEEHSRSIQRRLRRILQSWDVDDLTDDFRNLRL
ncbi:DNA dC-_dU-editing enzyme APOBEC-3H isoform X3 [Castor canadensis]|uniref:DNA dC->dU-editing enzyme APOBEC-3H isoform X3 n=1 Tax=Castor canadensis TaxID=51338 RepID=A0AC58NG44_CASCN